jgi:hypothetical protein
VAVTAVFFSAAIAMAQEESGSCQAGCDNAFSTVAGVLSLRTFALKIDQKLPAMRGTDE